MRFETAAIEASASPRNPSVRIRCKSSIDEILQWITAGLYGGYVAPNFLKWYWWRLNGVGYFTGMVSGTALALVQAALQDDSIPNICRAYHPWPLSRSDSHSASRQTSREAQA